LCANAGDKMTKQIRQSNLRQIYYAVMAIGIMYLNLFGGSYVMAATKKIVTANNDRLITLPNRAKIIDLTQPLNSSVPTYDGKPNEYKYQVLSTVDKDGYGSGAFFTHEHLGTHIDAPVHFCPGGTTIDKIDPSNLLLPAVIINVQDEVKKDPDYLLTKEKIKEFEKKNTIPPHAAVLLLTGWSKRYFIDGQYRNVDSKGIMHYPGFSLEAAKYLVEDHKIAALGIDTLSIDNGPSEEFPVHKFILSQGLFMVENLTNLDQLSNNGTIVIFAPLKIEGGTGSPARVLALVP
jgi:kynurenine formamidase